MMVLFFTGDFSLTIANVSWDKEGNYACRLRRTSVPSSIIVTSQDGALSVELPVVAPVILRRDMTQMTEFDTLVLKEDGQAINLTCSTALSGPRYVITD